MMPKPIATSTGKRIEKFAKESQASGIYIERTLQLNVIF